MAKRLLSERQLEYIENGADAVGAANVHNYETAVRTNLNEGVPQILSRFPELVPYLDVESVQDQIDGADIGLALGQLLTSVQRRRLAAMLIWGEQREGESNVAFLERAPDLIAEFEDDVSELLHRARTSGGQVEFLREVSDRLIAVFQEQIDARRTADDISMAVPVQEVFDWLTDQENNTRSIRLPEFVDVLYSPWDEVVREKFLTCRDLLISFGMHLEVDAVESDGTNSLGTKWGLRDQPTPTERKQYLSVVGALDGEIRTYVDQYFEAASVSQRDQLLDEAVAVLEGLTRPGRDLLDWDALHSVDAEWKGHHTRVAKRWSDDRPVALLELSRNEDGRREWTWTAFGEVVRTLWEHDIERADVEAFGFPAAIDEKTAAAALTAVEG